MLIGYARVSTRDQKLDSQREALTRVGCDRIFEEVASGVRADRPVLAEALDYARAGDVLCCFRLDRVARSLAHLTTLLREMEQRQIGFRSLSENLDTTSAGGRLVIHVFGAVAQFERDLVAERTMAGLQAARRRGRIGGRPRLMTPEKLEASRRLLASGVSAREVAAAIGVSVATVYRHLPVREKAPPKDQDGRSDAA